MNRDYPRWQRWSRRRLLRNSAIGGAGLSALALLGCGGQPSEPTASNSNQEENTAKRGGTLSRQFISTVFSGGNLDPHVQQASQTGLMGLFYQSLAKLDPVSREIMPHLATKWESPSPTELVFTLQDGVKFHDKPPASGRLLKADDVVFSFDRLKTNEPKFINKSLFASVDKVQVVDSNRVKMTLSEPDVTVLGNVAAFSAAILAPEVVEKYGTGNLTTPETAVGTGAFMMQALDDVSVEVVRNNNYWKPGMPYLDGVRVQLIGDDQASWSAFLAGQLDVAYIPGHDAKEVIADTSRTYNADWFADVSVQGVYMKVQREPFNDPRVTRALKLLIDHQEAVSAWADVWFGRGNVSAALPASMTDWDFTQEEYRTKFLQYKSPKQDAVREALSLLSAAGYTQQNPLRFPQNGYRDTGWGRAQTELLQAQYRRLGGGVVETELVLMDQPTITSSLAKGEFLYMLSGQVPPQPFDPDGYLRTFYHTKGARNYGKFSDPKLDAMIDKQKTLFDASARKAAVKDVLLYLMDNAPNTPWSGRYQSNVWHTKVQNFAMEANSSQ